MGSSGGGNSCGDGFAGLLCCRFTSQVGSPWSSFGQLVLDRIVDGRSGTWQLEMLQHQGGRKNGGQRIGDSLADDIRC